MKRLIPLLVALAAALIVFLFLSIQASENQEESENQPTPVTLNSSSEDHASESSDEPAGEDEAQRAAAVEDARRDAGAAFDHWIKFETAKLREHEGMASHYIDQMLGHQVFQIPPSGLNSYQAQALLMEDDELLLTSGRRLWTRELKHGAGLSGRFCYIHSNFCLSRLFETSFFIDGKPAVIYANNYRIQRYPSHTLVRYLFNSVTIEERKFITYDDRAIATYDAISRDGAAHEVSIEIQAPYFTMPRGGKHDIPLTGQGEVSRHPRLHLPRCPWIF